MKLIHNTRARRWMAVGAAAVYILADVAEGVLKGWFDETAVEVGHHLIGLVAAVAIFWVLWVEIRLANAAKDDLVQERERRMRLSADLAQHISQRLVEWRLTGAETEIAWLLLKGFSFAEIAVLRGVKEKTLRQQASNIYAKAGVRGRSEFSAAFMEDLIGGDQDERIDTE